MKSGRPPSFQEIATHFEFASLNAVRDHLRALEDKGAITKAPRKARSIRVNTGVIASEERDGIPLLGKIAAGAPIEAIVNHDRILPISAKLFSKGQLFALKISGESMIDEGIRSGDIAIIRHQQEINNGDIAAVILEEEATLKRVFRKGKQLILQASNANYPDMIITSAMQKNLRIAGQYVGLIRSDQLSPASLT